MAYDAPHISGEITDEANKDEAKRKGRQKSFAATIDDSVWFHTIYGILDGLSVSYSTVKFLCDISAKSQNEYHQKLADMLHEPTTIPIIIAETLLFTAISAIGNYGYKHDGDGHMEETLKKVWPYLRDILKGAKNGYKGIKSVAIIFKELGVFSDAGLRAFAIPVGLTIGCIGMLNRLYRRRLIDQRKGIQNDIKALKKRLQAINEYKRKKILHEIKLHEAKAALEKLMEIDAVQDKKDRLNALITKLEKSLSSLEDPGQKALNEYNRKKKQLENELSAALENQKAIQQEENPSKKQKKNLRKTQSNIKSLKEKLTKLKEPEPFKEPTDEDILTLEKKACEFAKKHDNGLNISTVIGAIADGPYLYAGILTLTASSTLATPLLGALCVVLFTMLCCAILTRWQEEMEEKRKLKLAVLEMKREKARERIDAAYENYTTAVDKSQDDDSIAELKALLISSHDDYAAINKEIRELNAPNLKSATIDGIQDGLSLFGSVSSLLFAAGIIMVLSGSAACPPAFAAIIATTIFLGLAAMIGFALYRRYKAKKEKAIYDKKVTEIESREERQRTAFDIRDCNTDGVTKGEFYFQQIFEVTRNLGTGPYKGDNLDEFMMSSKFKAHTNGSKDKLSLPMTIFMSIMGAIYTAWLVARAYGKGFSKTQKADAGEEKSEMVELLSTTIDTDEDGGEVLPPANPQPEQASILMPKPMTILANSGQVSRGANPSSFFSTPIDDGKKIEDAKGLKESTHEVTSLPPKSEIKQNHSSFFQPTQKSYRDAVLTGLPQKAACSQVV